MTTLLSLTSRLQNRVPSMNGTPAGYDELVQQAVRQYSLDAPIPAKAALPIQAGVTSYALPGDFIKLISVRQGVCNATPGVLLTGNGIVPLPKGTKMLDYRVVGQSLELDWQPMFDATWELCYGAAHVPDGDGNYPTLGAYGADQALHFAAYLALTEQAHKAAQDAWSYQIGAEQIDRTKMAAALRSEAESALKVYKDLARAAWAGGKVANAWE